ncbi:hypothetical protein [Streptomyces chryseus]|uniref:hypothetical protein n=1 Tax=Streptomyces chryseus TaxID=68186 RepID=UPI00110FCA37|nr:hypothetical protein [Streptomyces chryseus]GGX02188.1 hypothetical protein GCM10010353_17350 [Streptomyces chryseus]
MSDLALYLGALLVLGVMGVTWAVRLAHHAPQHPAPAKFTAPDPDARWLVCDETKCGHMATQHRRDSCGGWTCAGCGTSKGGAL